MNMKFLSIIDGMNFAQDTLKIQFKDNFDHFKATDIKTKFVSKHVTFSTL